MWVWHCAERYGDAIKHRRAFHSSSQWGGAWGWWSQGSQKNSWGVLAGPESSKRNRNTAPGLSLHQALPPAALQPWASQNGEHREALGGGLHLGRPAFQPPLLLRSAAHLQSDCPGWPLHPGSSSKNLGATGNFGFLAQMQGCSFPVGSENPPEITESYPKSFFLVGSALRIYIEKQI